MLKKEPQKGQPLANIYNLFSAGPLTKQATITRKPQPQKQEIQIVFHHPNLLYLSNKKEKSREEISKQIEENLIRQIQRRSKDFAQAKAEGFRPHTSDASLTKRNNFFQNSTQTRCFTSQQARKKKKTLLQNSEQTKLQVLGNSSTFSGTFAEKPETPQRMQRLQRKTTAKTEQINENQPELAKEKSQKLLRYLQSANLDNKIQTWKQMLNLSSCKSTVRLNMYLDIQKKFMKFNTHKLKTYSRAKSKLIKSYLC